MTTSKKAIYCSSIEELVRQLANEIKTPKTSFFLKNLVEKVKAIESQEGMPCSQTDGNFILMCLSEYLGKHNIPINYDENPPKGFEKTGIFTLHLFSDTFSVYICYIHIARHYMASFL